MENYLLSTGHYICYLTGVTKKEFIIIWYPLKLKGKKTPTSLHTRTEERDLILPGIQDTQNKPSFGIHPCTNTSLSIQTCHNIRNKKQIWRSLWKAADTKTANKFHRHGRCNSTHRQGEDKVLASSHNHTNCVVQRPVSNSVLVELQYLREQMV